MSENRALLEIGTEAKMGRRAGLVAVALAVALAGCTRNTVVVIVPNLPSGPDPACAVLPPGVPAITKPGPRIATGSIAFPAEARLARLRLGCAGVLYHIAPDGEPTDLRLVVENPPGYGFGTAVLAGLQATRYQPNPEDRNWHYLNWTLRETAPPVRPAPGYSPGPMPRTPSPDYNAMPSSSRT